MSFTPRQADGPSVSPRTTGQGLVDLIGGAPRPPSTPRPLTDIVGGRRTEDPGRELVRRVSMLGVDPRSSEGQQIIAWLDAGMDIASPDVQDLIDQYQSKLIGPQSRRTRSEDIRGTDLLHNQYGYLKGDEFRELDRIGTESLARTQERLAALGILDGYIEGKKDPKTVAAFETLLYMSNGEGLSWAEMLGDLERTKAEMGDDWAFGDGSGSGGDGPAPFINQAYLAPDYASLAQDVKTKLRSELGREPDESELALFTAEMSGWHREAFAEEESARRAEYDAMVAAGESGADEGTPDGEFQTVDHLARFKESFEQKFKAERQGLERRAEVEDSQALTSGAVSTLSQMSGGMG